MWVYSTGINNTPGGRQKGRDFVRASYYIKEGGPHQRLTLVFRSLSRLLGYDGV